ncbi:MAG: hypothetical protein LBJ78_03505 [Puniceicoccales bacterium]|nr:hypothetical protein [Puniceicoccales bacterium]
MTFKILRLNNPSSWVLAYKIYTFCFIILFSIFMEAMIFPKIDILKTYTSLDYAFGY